MRVSQRDRLALTWPTRRCGVSDYLDRALRLLDRHLVVAQRVRGGSRFGAGLGLRAGGGWSRARRVLGRLPVLLELGALFDVSGDEHRDHVRVLGLLHTGHGDVAHGQRRLGDLPGVLLDVCAQQALVLPGGREPRRHVGDRGSLGGGRVHRLHHRSRLSARGHHGHPQGAAPGQQPQRDGAIDAPHQKLGPQVVDLGSGRRRNLLLRQLTRFLPRPLLPCPRHHRPSCMLRAIWVARRSWSESSTWRSWS